MSEAYSELEKCVGEVLRDDWKALSIRPSAYLLSIRIKPVGAIAGADPDTLHVILVSDHVMEIRDAGITVFDYLEGALRAFPKAEPTSSPAGRPPKKK